MLRQPGADARAVAIHEVEHTRRHARFIHNFRKQNCIQRCNFRWLQDHRATCRNSRADFCCDLIERPVPRRDQRAHANGLTDDAAAADIFFPLEGIQRIQGVHQVAEASWCLCCICERQGCAHLARHGGSDVWHALLIRGNDLLQQRRALRDGGFGKGLERTLGRGNGAIHVFFIADGDGGNHRLVGGVQHLEGLLAVGLNPLAVDIKLALVLHGLSGVFTGGRLGCRGTRCYRKEAAVRSRPFMQM